MTINDFLLTLEIWFERYPGEKNTRGIGVMVRMLKSSAINRFFFHSLKVIECNEYKNRHGMTICTII
jgi:hypothetical protein